MGRISSFCVAVLFLGLAYAVSLASAKVEIRSAGSMDNFWAEEMSKRGLGELDRWRYTSFDGTSRRRMNLREEHFAQHLFAFIGQERKGAASNSTYDSWYFPNTVFPAVDGGKFVSEIFSEMDNETVVLDEEGSDLADWACDLDWSQPDPFADHPSARIFAASQGYCALEDQLVLIKAKGVNDALEQIPSSLLNSNRFSNMVIACTYIPRDFYCSILFADVQPLLFDDCAACCSSTACLKRK